MSDADPKAGGQAPPLQEVLRQDARRRRRRVLVWIAVVLCAVAAFVAYRIWSAPDEAAGPAYRTEPAEVGTLVVRVAATGNLKPTNQVEIGSEISGIVTEVLVDANDPVVRGQVLLQIDTTRLNAAVATSSASLQVAQAQVEQARATQEEARQVLSRLEELFALSEGRSPAEIELDSATAAARRADAAVAAARASVTQARANLQSDEVSFEKATIRSPIDGVVLSRAVEPGQTVAATFQAPVLFTIAEDLAQMELEVAIDEADVGQVAIGQLASFSVDAWPGRTYDGAIMRVELGAQQVDGVVSYPAIISVHNSDLSLRPGMTATADIVTLTHESVLLVPNAALRFDPEATASTTGGSTNFVSRLFARPSSSAGRTALQISEGRHVWVLRDGVATQVPVTPVASNGQFTEIEPGEITAGTPLIVESLRNTR